MHAYYISLISYEKEYNIQSKIWGLTCWNDNIKCNQLYLYLT
jgi:hypothetical protein